MGTIYRVKVPSTEGDIGVSKEGKRKQCNNLLERILARENMLKAMKRVIANKGSHGVDGMRVDELPTFIIDNRPRFLSLVFTFADEDKNLYIMR